MSKFVNMDGIKSPVKYKNFVQDHIHLAECKGYTPDYTRDRDTCVCGRNKAWHENKPPVPPAGPQNNVTSTLGKKTEVPVYGTIKFVGYGKTLGGHAPYMRVEDYHCKKYLDNIWKVIQEHWQLKPPRLVIGVTGGAKRFDLSPRLQKALKTGLVKCAQSTGAWLHSGGTKTGVREIVGEAVRDFYYTAGGAGGAGGAGSSGGGGGRPVVALGAVSWNQLTNRDCLTPNDRRGLHPAVYDEQKNTMEGRSLPLDPNHTHFLFVDKSHTRHWEFSTSEFRSALFNNVKIKAMNGTDQEISVPQVVVVINGGIGAVKEVMKYADIYQLPIVIVKGSGRACDYICYALEMVHTDSSNEVVYPDDFDTKLYNYAKDVFEWKEKDLPQQDEKIRESIGFTRLITAKIHTVTIFNVDGENNDDLETAILDAIFNANESNHRILLHMVLAWDKPEIAKDKLFTIENKQQWKKPEYRSLLYQAMFTALVNNQVQFVELFIENGVEWDQFLSVKTLRDLYYEILVKKTNSNVTSESVNELMQSMLINDGSYRCCGSDMHALSTAEKYLHYVGQTVSLLSNDIFGNIYQGKEYYVHEAETTPDPCKTKQQTWRGRSREVARLYPCRELFLWSILQNRRDMAALFWRENNSCIATGLVGCAILKTLAEYAEESVEIEHSARLIEHAGYFESQAIGVLQECYAADRTKTHRLLVAECQVWDHTTVLNIAFGKDMMEFMGQSACQTKLNRIWYGRLTQYTSIWQVLGTMACPLLLFTVKFTETADKPDDLKMMRSMGDIGSRWRGQAKPNDVLPEHPGPVWDDMEAEDQDESQADTGAAEGDSAVYRVRCWGGCGDRMSVAYLMAGYYFLQSPLVKFCYQTLSTLCFVVLFSYVLIVEVRPWTSGGGGAVGTVGAAGGSDVSWAEYLVWVWALSIWLEEIRQIGIESNRQLQNKLRSYVKSSWNLLDLASFLLLLLSIVLRYTLTGADFGWARLSYCLTLACYYIRIMQNFFVSKNLGPKVIMIKRMLKDLTFFLLIMVLFVACYGAVSQAIRNPNPTLDWSLVRNVVYEPYWNIYGELFLENLENDIPDCSSNATVLGADSGVRHCHTDRDKVVITLFLAVYMVIMAILLLNLLIAMFSYTFDTVQENAEQMWRFYRYSLVHEYYDRPVLPPPFIIANHAWRLLLFVWNVCRGNTERNTEFSINLSEDEENKLLTLERTGLDQYMTTLDRHEQDRLETRVTNSIKKIERLACEVEGMRKAKAGLSRYATQRSLSYQAAPPPTQAPPPNTHHTADLTQIKDSLSALTDQVTTITTLLAQMQQQQQQQQPPPPAAPAAPAPQQQTTAEVAVRPRTMTRHDSNVWVTQCPVPEPVNYDEA